MISNGTSNKCDIKKYRPISKTPYLAKIFEKLFSFRLVNFLETNKILLFSGLSVRFHEK